MPDEVECVLNKSGPIGCTVSMMALIVLDEQMEPIGDIISKISVAEDMQGRCTAIMILCRGSDDEIPVHGEAQL